MLLNCWPLLYENCSFGSAFGISCAKCKFICRGCFRITLFSRETVALGFICRQQKKGISGAISSVFRQIYEVDCIHCSPHFPFLALWNAADDWLRSWCSEISQVKPMLCLTWKLNAVAYCWLRQLVQIQAGEVTSVVVWDKELFFQQKSLY